MADFKTERKKHRGEQNTAKGLPVNDDVIKDAAQRLEEYRNAKKVIDNKATQNHEWWRMRHWPQIQNQKADADISQQTGEPKATSAWLFNSIINKHADIMDNFPKPNVLPRQQDDVADAKSLSDIKRVYYTCNPGGQGHAYVKRVFIDRRFNSNENPDDYTFIQALVDDNTALMEAQPEYVQQLEALPEKLRQAWRHGRWDVFEGQVFGEFVDDPAHYADRIGTHVIEPFDIPKTWTIYRGFDWGYAKPFSVGWYAIDYDGCMYRFRELYGCTGEADVGVEWTVERVAEAIREVETTDPQLKDRKIVGVADPAIWQENGGVSIAETMEKYRVYFNKGDHKRIPGKMQCHYRLAFDERQVPMFYVFNTCKYFIRTIPALIYSETQVEDIDTKMEDHIYDEWRYVCMERPIAPREKHTAKVIDVNNIEDPLNMIRDQQAAKHRNYDYIQLL